MADRDPDPGWEIRPGRGIGPIVLGRSPDELRPLLGPPEEEIEDDRDGVLSVSWYFRSRGLYLHFHQERGFRLEGIEVTSERATLAGRHVLGIDEAALRAALPDFHPRPAVEHPQLDTRELTFPDAALTFWVESGVVRSVQIGPRFDDRDEPIWPGGPLE